jgi:lysophospholipase L1-like esterase
LSPRLLAIAVTPARGSESINIAVKAAAQSEGVQFVEMPMPVGSTLADHIHLNAAGYRIWTPALVTAIVSTR